MLKRGAVMLAVAIAGLMATTEPAAAAPAPATQTVNTGGWQFQGSFPDFWDCIQAGEEMIANGTAVSWQCNLEGANYSLYTVPGPWVFHSSHSTLSRCSNAGQTLMANGSVNTWQCLREGSRYSLYTA
ncbi:MAG TPA: hypothetical protein DGG94_16555 [Micromonosporaceae bacterium]|nr:hypothetical protein [Micromonosporaceae bacterium]HCU51382.1 hypothetical protein [Micromonosporaceae bacterium]